jgi:ParB-like chromosome segregation protein Spo0J
MKIEKRLIKDLKPAEYNPRQSTQKQETKLKQSLEKFGVVEPIIVNENEDRNNIIVGGHFRVRELKKLGYKEVDCVLVNLSIQDEKELNIRLNANTGEWDFDILANQFDDFELVEWGMNIPQIENMPDLSILEDSSNDDKLNELAEGVRKGVMIEFEPEHYQEAYDLIKYWREKQLYIGKFLIDKLKQEKDKL